MPHRSCFTSFASLMTFLAALPLLLPMSATGLDVEFPEITPVCGREFYDNRFVIVVNVLSDTRALVNQEGPLPLIDAAKLVKKASRTQAEKWLVIRTSGKVHWGQFVWLVDQFRGEGIGVAWLTSAMEATMHNDPDCDAYTVFPARPRDVAYWRWFQGK